MPTDDSTYIATLSGVPQCEGSSSFRWSWEGNSLAYQRRLQVPKLNGVQVTDGKQEPTHKWNRCVKRSVMRACNRAIRHGQAQPLYLCTFRFLQIPEECLAADHRCLALSRMLTECWRRQQPTPSLDGMARTGPQPHVSSRCGLDVRPSRSQFATVFRLELQGCPCHAVVQRAGTFMLHPASAATAAYRQCRCLKKFEENWIIRHSPSKPNKGYTS